jgi:acetylornithine deacetylase/succinyl-diaminopimelate desuccinylase
VLSLDRRTVPGESFQTIVVELTDLLARIEQAYPGLSTSVRRSEGGMSTLLHVALVTPPDSPLTRAAEQARGLAAPEGAAASGFTSFPAWTDGALLSGYAGIPTIVLGPGDLSLAHSPRESIATVEIEEAARIYAALALRFCAGEAP